MRFIIALTAAAMLAGCTDPKLAAEVKDLQAKVADLEKQVQAGAKAGPRGPAAAAAVDPEKEKAAGELLRAANEAKEKGDAEAAKGKLAELKEKFGDTRAAKAAARIEQELAVIGVDAGGVEAEKWYQGETTFADGKATLVVFWEVWCPHCKREVPKLQATFDQYNSKGLNVIGLTKQTRNIGDDQVASFLKDNKVTYPIAKEQGDAMSKRFAVRGIPAAAVVKDGKIVWRGHPARINEEMINGWIN